MTLPNPSITIVPGKAEDSPPYAEAFWRHPMPTGKKKPKKKRLGKIWVDRAGDGWAKRKGRTPEGWLDERTVHQAAADAVQAFQQELEDQAAAKAAAGAVTFRRVAWEWYAELRDVKGATPKTLEDHGYMLAEPGVPHKRGPGVSAGRIMKEFGDDPIEAIDAKRVSQFLKELDKELGSPRNVNAHRAVLHAVFAFAMSAETHSLPVNPVAGTSRRSEPPRKRVEFYESDEVELLCGAAAAGAHRRVPMSAGKPARLTDEEIRHRQLEDDQDADLYRLLFLSALRLGEIRDLRPRQIELLPSMDGGYVDVSNRLSAGVSISGAKLHDEGRDIAIPEAAARAIARQMLRFQERFGFAPKPNSVLFCSRTMGALSETALRRRYYRACEAVGLRRLTLHQLRHAAGSHVGRESSSSAVFTRDFLGHSKLSTTDRYTHSKMRTPEAIAIVNRAFRSGPENGEKETA